jgi:hypothetical protein
MAQLRSFVAVEHIQVHTVRGAHAVGAVLTDIACDRTLPFKLRDNEMRHHRRARTFPGIQIASSIWSRIASKNMALQELET